MGTCIYLKERISTNKHSVFTCRSGRQCQLIHLRTTANMYNPVKLQYKSTTNSSQYSSCLLVVVQAELKLCSHTTFASEFRSTSTSTLCQWRCKCRECVQTFSLHWRLHQYWHNAKLDANADANVSLRVNRP